MFQHYILTTPIGLTFSPDGSVAYVTDTGAGNAFYGSKPTAPSAMSVYPPCCPSSREEQSVNKLPAIATPSKKTAPGPPASSSHSSPPVSRTASTATARVTSTLASGTASTCGAPLASSWARYSLVRRVPTLISPGTGGWLFVRRRSCIMLRSRPREGLWPVRCLGAAAETGLFRTVYQDTCYCVNVNGQLARLLI